MIKTVLKHWIYELCIKQTFDAIKRNFPSNNKFIPSIGDKFRVVVDVANAETYFDCEIILPREIEYYNDYADDEKRNMFIAFKFKRLRSQDMIISENDSQYFTQEEFTTLKFKK
jgi:hypothetical protein